MKILHIGISDHLGGIETYLHKISSHIDLTAYEFHFLTYHGITPCFYEELCDLGCRFQRVTSRRKSPWKFRSEFDALLKRERYDIVHCHLNTLSFTEPINIALKNKIPVIAHSRNGEMAGNRLSRFLHLIHYMTLPKARIKLLAVSDVAGKWMFGTKADVTVLNNGVDLSRFHFNQEDRNRVREEFGIGDERLIIHTGAFRTQKNHDFMIDIFAEVHKLEPNTKLLMVGSGPLKSTIAQKVRDLGLQDYAIFADQRSDIPRLLSAADVFLFPSLYEGFPNAMLEAEATGLFCVVSDTITKEVEMNGQCAYLSLDKSAEEWAATIHRIIPSNDRNAPVQAIQAAKLDVVSDIRRLEQIYTHVRAD